MHPPVQSPLIVLHPVKNYLETPLIWVLIQVLLILQVLLEIAKGLFVEKLKSTLVKQLEKAVNRREIFYLSCYTWTSCESGGRATTVAAAATATGGGATRMSGRGVAISSIAASASFHASRGAACTYS